MLSFRAFLLFFVRFYVNSIFGTVNFIKKKAEKTNDKKEKILSFLGLGRGM